KALGQCRREGGAPLPPLLAVVIGVGGERTMDSNDDRRMALAVWSHRRRRRLLIGSHCRWTIHAHPAHNPRASFAGWAMKVKPLACVKLRQCCVARATRLLRPEIAAGGSVKQRF